MAYAKVLKVPNCQRCTRKATCEVFNRYNASHGYFCRTCGAGEVRRLAEDEQAAERIRSAQRAATGK